MIGNPSLDKERAWQVDFGLEVDYCNWRGRAGAFHTWIVDYATFTGKLINDPSGARLLRSTNTDLATLTGFELYGESDLSYRLSAFGSMNYVDGRDREIGTPLAGISPLDSRVGFRLTDQCEGQIWGLECGARIVNNQDSLGGLRIGTVNVVGIDAFEGPTPGFTLFYLRGYWNVTEDVHLVGGFDNLFNRTYLEHLDLRLPVDGAIPASYVLAPGFTPYLGMEWTR